MRNLKMMLALVAIVLAGACSDDRAATPAAAAGSNDTTANAQQNLTPEELGELGAKIAKNSNDAQKILSERGLNEQSFEQAVRKVSEDPAAAKRYSEAYKRASA